MEPIEFPNRVKVEANSTQATLKLVQRQVEALKAQRARAVTSLAQAKAQCDQTQINLGYTTVQQTSQAVSCSSALPSVLAHST